MLVLYRPEYIKTQLFWRAIGEQYSGARAKVTVIGYLYMQGNPCLTLMFRILIFKVFIGLLMQFSVDHVSMVKLRVI